MTLSRWMLATVIAWGLLGTVQAADAPPAKTPVQAALEREIVGSKLPIEEVQKYLEPRILPMPVMKTAAEWEAYANQMRQETLDRVVYRGEAAKWRDAKTKVEWLEEIEGGPGYRIKKLRYEALPGMWIPALLYVPEKVTGKVPVFMNVNGHDGNGKQAPYKQIRCINQAKRGIIALNVEWFGMGQLATANMYHYRMNQIDLCGSSGLAPFYLSMKRGLDILLSLENADPTRVGVAGLSGGGWQTITISSLDTRVTLSNPVAGYSSFKTRVKFLTDLGDSEQTPVDLAAVTDYAHMTAMRAPRATLLTFNDKDNCCFASGHALPPLMQAAGPIFKLYGKEASLRSHVNSDPGTHNFDKDNRQALYHMIGTHFFGGSAGFDATEIPSDDEVKTKEQLNVAMPEVNADFNSLARGLMKSLPRNAELPADKAAAEQWQKEGRERLQKVVAGKSYQVKAEQAAAEEKDGLKTVLWKLKLDDQWTVPAVELSRGDAKKTVIVVADAGRKSVSADVERLLKEGNRVLAVDPFYIGESTITQRNFLFALLVASTGDRPIGLQASQVGAIANWAKSQYKVAPRIVAVGQRASLFSLIAAALSPEAISGVELSGSLGSLKEVIETNMTFDQAPELFCFGLLEQFDIKQLSALVAPRPVVLSNPSDRAKAELSGLKGWYATLGSPFSPIAANEK